MHYFVYVTVGLAGLLACLLLAAAAGWLTSAPLGLAARLLEVELELQVPYRLRGLLPRMSTCFIHLVGWEREIDNASYDLQITAICSTIGPHAAGSSIMT